MRCCTLNPVCTLQVYVVPALNRDGARGLPIPTLDGVTLIKPNVSLGNGYLIVDADMSYQPPSL